MKILICALTLLAFITPAFAQYDVDADPCASSDRKSFMQGNFVVLGQNKNEARPVPDAKDLYAGAAEVELKGCSLIVTKCVGGETMKGEIKHITGLADKIPMWVAEFEGGRKYFFQMATDLDNYPALYGWGKSKDGETAEYWRAVPEASCSAPA